MTKRALSICRLSLSSMCCDPSYHLLACSRIPALECPHKNPQDLSGGSGSSSSSSASREKDAGLTCEVTKSQLMHFLAADFEEGRKNIKAAKTIYESILTAAPTPLVLIQYQRCAVEPVVIFSNSHVFFLDNVTVSSAGHQEDTRLALRQLCSV